MTKSEQIHLTISAETKSLLKQAAGKTGLNLTNFIRLKLTEAANIH